MFFLFRILIIVLILVLSCLLKFFFSNMLRILFFILSNWLRKFFFLVMIFKCFVVKSVNKIVLIELLVLLK